MIADLGELRRLDLDERRPGEPGQPAGDFGFAHAGRADHDDILRRHILPQPFGKLLPPPAIADGHGDRPLGVGLADDVFVEFRNDLSRGEVLHDVL